jgi:hypothetical protein
MCSGMISVKNQFLVTGVKFYSKDPNYLSLFQGFSYDNNNLLYNSINHELIKPFSRSYI